MEALVIVDMQKYFVSEELRNAFPDMALPVAIIPSLKKCLDEARSLQIPVIHVRTEYQADKSDWPESKKHRDSIYCLAGSRGAEIISGLEPLEKETVIVKKRYSGFYNTDLEKKLKELGIESISFAGYALDGCVRFTAVDAFNIGIRTKLLEDCLLSSLEATEKSLEYLRIFIQSEITDSETWLNSFRT